MRWLWTITKQRLYLKTGSRPRMRRAASIAIERLNWLASRLPSAKYLRFPGGLIAKSLFEETRYCFAYGQYLATIILGLAFAERTLAALFYGWGRDDLERASLSVLLREARTAGLVRERELEALDRARAIRNSVTHFRRPLREDTVEYRAVKDKEHPYVVLEQDARGVLEVVMGILAKNVC